MRDARLDKWATVLVDYSLGVEAGQLISLVGPPEAGPLLEAIYERLLHAGAHVRVNCVPESFSELFFHHASEEQLSYISPLAQHEIATVDGRIHVAGPCNTRALSGIDPRRQGLASAARRPIMRTFLERAAAGDLRWTTTLFPVPASAQDADMGQHDYEEFVLRAGFLDCDDPVTAWRDLEARQQLLADFLTGAQELHFQTPAGTDLRVNVNGMTWINCAGHENFPDGEVFTGPNLAAADGGVNGVMQVSFPAVAHGREADGIRLVFEGGRVVEGTASKNQEFLRAMLDQDEGARGVGEIALGTNYSIPRHTRNILFDEKLGGTFHLAVGAGYPETGNNNDSGLHLDLICDLRGGGTVTVDGEVICRDGRFVDERWPQPPAAAGEADDAA